MPTYILLSSLTPEGSQTLHKDPERLDAVNKEISEFGCKIVTQHGQDHDATCDTGRRAQGQAQKPQTDG